MNTNSNTKLRRYQPIWEQIKKHRKATIVAPSCVHKKIFDGVKKEKWRDQAYKLLLAEAGIRVKLYKRSDKKKNIIVFTIKQTNGVSLEDL